LKERSKELLVVWLRPFRVKRVRLALPVLAALSLGGCQVSFVTDYDDVFDQELTGTQKDVDALLSGIERAPTRPYASFATQYATVGTDMDALALRAKVHQDNVATVNSVKQLQESFAEFQTLHAAKPVSPTFVKIKLDELNGQFAILMSQEVLKKSGQGKGG
jgi:hypothetical protein